MEAYLLLKGEKKRNSLQKRGGEGWCMREDGGWPIWGGEMGVWGRGGLPPKTPPSSVRQEGKILPPDRKIFGKIRDRNDSRKIFFPPKKPPRLHRKRKRAKKAPPP